MAVDVACDGATGLERAVDTDYDVIVLDRDLPGVHGDEICRRLVESRCRARVLMLTAAGTMDDLVDGLELGADDYLPQPFHFPVLVARIGALYRRAQPAIPPVLRHDDIELDRAQHRVTRQSRALDLSPKEFSVLELLLSSVGRTVSAEEMLERVWEDSADPFTHAVKVTMSRLRTKLGEPGVIETVPRAGYRI